MVNTVIEASTTMRQIKPAEESKHHQEFIEVINSTKAYLNSSKITEITKKRKESQLKTFDSIPDKIWEEMKMTLGTEFSSSPNYKYEMLPNGEVTRNDTDPWGHRIGMM